MPDLLFGRSRHALDTVIAAVHEVEAIIQERDEAREEVRRLQGMLSAMAANAEDKRDHDQARFLREVINGA